MKFKVGDVVIYKEHLFTIRFVHPFKGQEYRYKVYGRLDILYDFTCRTPGIRLATKLDRLLLGLDKSDNAVHNKPEETL